MNIAVLGASGYIGSNLVPELVKDGHTVRAISRRREVLEARAWRDVEVVEADALDPSTLAPALAGVEVVYYLVHSMGSGPKFAELDKRAATNLREAAAAAGVKRVIYLGGFKPSGRASEHLKSRLETGDILRGGSVPVTELRASIIVGAGSAGFEVLRDLVNHLPAMITPKWVMSRTQPIALTDLLGYLVGVLHYPETTGRTYDVAGPELLRYRDLIVQFGEVTGKKRYLIPVPVITPRLSSYWLGLVTSVPVSVARPLVDGLRTDIIGDPTEIQQIIPMALHTYRDAVRLALRSELEQPLPARWAEGAILYRGYNPEISFYSKAETESLRVNAPASVMWEVVRSIGGKRGYYYADRLWWLRGLLDRAVGGVGMRRGRRDAEEVRLGDAIDFWRVAQVDQGRLLTLVAEMKLPGKAILEFEVTPDGEDRCVLDMAARFHPSGMPGLLYWYSVTPFHTFIFREMPRRMAKEAERRAAVRKSRV